jgi:hypothetical protein
MNRIKGYRDGIEPEIKPLTPVVVEPTEIGQEAFKFDFDSMFSEKELRLIGALMPNDDQVIEECLQQIWKKYDRTGSR